MGVKNISLVWEDTLGCTKQTVLGSSNNQLLLQKDALKEYHIDCTILTVLKPPDCLIMIVQKVRSLLRQFALYH